MSGWVKPDCKMSDNKTDEGYNEFVKEYGLRENWCNETWDDWIDWDDLF
ncbi:11859_t:CDS:2 [Gigaspora rosea]|nr:11859_t:CDS:2 [Gigaspora rosea]